MRIESRKAGARGVALVEFALTLALFLTFVFALIECARALYLWNTLHEVTRRAARAAAVANFADTTAIAALRQDALFRSSAGQLILGGGIDDSYVRIDYLSLASDNSLQQVTAMPPCPTRNQINCLNDPRGASCIRFVRARVCVPGAASSCDGAPFTTMVAWLDAVVPGGMAMVMPTADTVVPAESLGFRPGMADCP